MNQAVMLVNSVGRAALDATAAPGLLQPWIDKIEAQVRRDGKFPRRAAGYLPFAPPPVFWDYKCHKCRWWNFGTCNTVAGEIRPGAWCTLWVPAPAYKAFTWPRELLRRG